MTAEEKEEFLAENPLLGVSVLPKNIKVKALKAARKCARVSHLERKQKRRLADDHALRNREKEMKDEEKRNTAALTKFKANKNRPCYTTMEILQEELQKMHPPPSNLPLYSDAMKCEVVIDQLRYREARLGRVLRKGALHSSHRGGSTSKLVLLIENFAQVLEDERGCPSLMNLPEIRKTYQGYQFPIQLRLELDETRTTMTKNPPKNSWRLTLMACSLDTDAPLTIHVATAKIRKP